MFKFYGFLYIAFSAVLIVRSQDIDFLNAISGIIGQWGSLLPNETAELFLNYQQGGLSHIWNSLNDHCSSNYQCGPDACCLKPVIQGKRAIDGGSVTHFASYCAKLRDLGDSCSEHLTSVHYYNSHCPCKTGLKCKPSSYVQLTPFLSVPINSVCIKA